MTQMQGKATTTNQPLSIPASSLLVVDDHSMNRIMLSRYITKLGYQASLAENGRQALEKLQAEPFDLVLLDVQMPEMDGFEATSAIRAAGNPTPIVAMTAHAMATDRELCRQAGMPAAMDQTPVDLAGQNASGGFFAK